MKGAPGVRPPAAARLVGDVLWAGWEAARDAGPAGQYRLFAQMLRAVNAEVYDSIPRGLPINPDELVPRAMRLMRPVEPTVRVPSGQLAADLPRQPALFKESFTDFRCTTPVYFLFAAGAFDGATRQVGAAVCLTPPAGSTDDAAWTT